MGNNGPTPRAGSSVPAAARSGWQNWDVAANGVSSALDRTVLLIGWRFWGYAWLFVFRWGDLNDRRTTSLLPKPQKQQKALPATGGAFCWVLFR